MIGRILILGLLFCIKICPTLSPINEVKSKNHLTYAQTYYSEDCSYDKTNENEKEQLFSFILIATIT